MTPEHRPKSTLRHWHCFVKNLFFHHVFKVHSHILGIANTSHNNDPPTHTHTHRSKLYNARPTLNQLTRYFWEFRIDSTSNYGQQVRAMQHGAQGYTANLLMVCKWHKHIFKSFLGKGAQEQCFPCILVMKVIVFPAFQPLEVPRKTFKYTNKSLKSINIYKHITCLKYSWNIWK